MIALAQTNQKHKGRNVHETMNPHLPLALLATDIKQHVRQLSDLECRLRGSRYFYTIVQYILVSRKVRG